MTVPPDRRHLRLQDKVKTRTSRQCQRLRQHPNGEQFDLELIMISYQLAGAESSS